MTGISSVTFEPLSRVLILGEFAFARSFIESICLPSSTDTIPKSCFRPCGFLLNLAFESDCKIRVLGEEAFAGCWSLQSVCIPASIQIISTGCFRECTDLSEVKFEGGFQISLLGEYAFDGCSSLEMIYLRSSIETRWKISGQSPELASLVSASARYGSFWHPTLSFPLNRWKVCGQHVMYAKNTFYRLLDEKISFTRTTAVANGPHYCGK
jgi:hypothetical protein